MTTLNTGELHHALLRHIIDRGHAPPVRELASSLTVAEAEVTRTLQRLQDEHGVVLHPGSDRAWVVHPFSLAPTSFVVDDGRQRWWSSCAWCSLGAATLLDRDVTITSTLGAEGRQVELHVRDGQVAEGDLLVHFPVPMRQAWDNVIYMCSTMLLFDDEQSIDAWCRDHRIPRGDVQPVANLWPFARAWYGNHLAPDWRKWTTSEARALFAEFGLAGDTWDLPTSAERF